MLATPQIIEERAFRLGEAYAIDDLATFLPEDISRLIDALPLWRRREVLSFRREESRREEVLSFFLLMYALREAGVSEAVTFDYLEHGKPILRQHPEIAFNMSHCCEAVACLVGSSPVGIDVERRGRYKALLAPHILNDEEMERVLSAADVDLAFTTLWTQKEAVVKLTGEGVKMNMQNVISTHPEITLSSYVRDTYVLSTARLL